MNSHFAVKYPTVKENLIRRVTLKTNSALTATINDIIVIKSTQ